MSGSDEGADPTRRRAPSSFGETVPAAPYPPLGYGHVRSSLSSAPHYPTTTTGGRAGSRGGPSRNLSPPTTDPAATDDDDVTAATAAAAGLSSDSHHQRQFHSSGSVGSPSGGTVPIYSSQVMFCPGWHDIVATINCVSPARGGGGPGGFSRSPDNNSTGTRKTFPRAASSTSLDELGSGRQTRKAGPVMLELRRVVLVNEAFHPPGDSRGYHRRPDRNGGSDDDDGDFADDQRFFATRTVAVSRGNPSLGTSVSSTCLDVPPVQTYDANRLLAATGTTTGALCIHQFDEGSGVPPGGDGYDGDDLPGAFSASIEYFHTQRHHHRQASAVAWRPAVGSNSHVALGLVGTTPVGTVAQKNHRMANTGTRTGGDREFCCFVWDVVDSKRAASPLTKLALNSPVASLAWMMDGQTLAVGGHQRTVQLYDMRSPGGNVPPLSAHAHESGVHGIHVDPHRPYLMATFCRAVGEPVKLFDVRRMDSAVSEIKIAGTHYHHHLGVVPPPSAGNAPSLLGSARKTYQACVEAVQWNLLEPGVLTIATTDSVQDYDTSSGSRPSLVRVGRCKRGSAVKGIALYRGREGRANTGGRKGRRDDQSDRMLSMLYPHRVLAVLDDRSIQDMSKATSAPLAISHRDGRVVHALGPHVWTGAARPGGGPAAMDGTTGRSAGDDVSAVMMRRARYHQAMSYSMSPESNVKMLSKENATTSDENAESVLLNYGDRALLRLWSWIDRVELLSFQDLVDVEDDQTWVGKSLLEAGVFQLLGMDVEQSETHAGDEAFFSEIFLCNKYHSPGRRSALTACGWAGKFDLTNVMAECEALGEFERSAALAVWHGDIRAAVEALQRASEEIRAAVRERKNPLAGAAQQYAETLDLVAMCVAGFGGKTTSQLAVWRNACANLLRRSDLSGMKAKESRIAYLRGLCQFLLNVGTDESYVEVLDNMNLSMSDRAAFACLFLERKELKAYLIRCVERCKRSGSVEGLVIAGLSKSGIDMLQSFVDRCSDVQTAALVVSRVVLPADWAVERRCCIEWVESYRSLLNIWQLWQTRAMFDVDRAEVLRRFKARSNPGGNYQRRLPNPRVRLSPKPLDPDIMPSIPAQLEVRCNYCSSPLSLKRNEGTTNQWLSKMQPMLNCCPQCRKPLPRCSICMLSMGAMNPYMELTRDRSRPGPRGSSSKLLPDDLSSLSSMNFAEWYTWCMR